MIDKSSRRPGTRVAVKSAPDPLTFPPTLTGTLHAPVSGLSKADALQQVAALETVGTALTSLRQDVSRSMRSTESAPGMNTLLGRTDSQGRMDLIARLTGKLKDMVNPNNNGLRPFADALSRSRP